MLLKTISLYLDTRQKLEIAMSLASRLFGVVVSRQTEVELLQAAASQSGDAFEKFHTVCNREKSKLVLCRILSSAAESTGLGSGVAKGHQEVRDDIRQIDGTIARRNDAGQAKRPSIRGSTTHFPRLRQRTGHGLLRHLKRPASAQVRLSHSLVQRPPALRQPAFDFRAPFCHCAPMEAHAFGFRLRANARRTKSDFISKMNGGVKWKRKWLRC